MHFITGMYSLQLYITTCHARDGVSDTPEHSNHIIPAEFLSNRRGQQPPGREPGGVGGEAGGSGSGGHGHGIGGGDDDGISTTPLWAAPYAPALLRSETELGASGAGPGASRARRQHGRRA